MNRINLLVSARDPAAAFHMAAICRVAQNDSRFQLTLAAQPPASDILTSQGFTVLEVPPLIAHSASDGAGDALKKIAREILCKVGPQVLLCGLSSPTEGGIDEALLACRNVPALMMQDFWGEQNTFWGRGADALLVLDETASLLSRSRHGATTLVTGSPRHSEYAKFDSIAARNRIRALLDISKMSSVIGLFGQPLQTRQGYHRTLEVLGKAVLNLPFQTVLLYRPHPRESVADRSWTKNCFQAIGVPVITLDKITTEESLAVCDIVCTVFSNCIYDSAFLNYFSPEPLITPIALLYNKELKDFYEEITDFKRLPYFSGGLAFPVWQERDLEDALAEALKGQIQERVWQAARQVLPDPSLAIERVLAAIVAASEPTFAKHNMSVSL